MSKEAVKWAMDDAPMLFMEKSGKADTTARHILAVLAEHANPLAWPSNQQIRFRTGYDERTIQRALARLEAEQLIIRDGTKNGCPVWRMALHRKRPASDREQLLAEAEAKKVATAKRVAEYRARKAAGTQVADSAPVTSTDAVPVTSGLVTDSASVRIGLSDGTYAALSPYVTGATPPEPVVEPVVEPGAEPRPPRLPQQPPGPVSVEDEGFDPIALELAQHEALADMEPTAKELTEVLALARAQTTFRINNIPSWAYSRNGLRDIRERLYGLRRRRAVAAEPRPHLVVNDTHDPARECPRCQRALKDGQPEAACICQRPEPDPTPVAQAGLDGFRQARENLRKQA